MKNKQQNEPARLVVLRAAAAIGLTYGSEMMLSAVFQFPAQPFRGFGIAVAAVAACLLIDALWALTPKTGKLFAVAGLAGLTVIFWYGGFFHAIGHVFQDYASFVAVYNLYDPRPTEFGIRATLWLTAAASAVICNRFVVYHTSGAAILITYLTMIALPFPVVDPAQYTAAILILLASMLYFFLLRAFLLQRKKFGPDVRLAPFLRAGAPVCAVILLVSTFLPYSEASSGLSFDLPDPVYDFLEVNFDGGFFPTRPLIPINVSDDVRLGGSNFGTDYNLFTVRAEEPFYLYSGVYDVYTGSTWEHSPYGSFMDGSAGPRYGADYPLDEPNPASIPRFLIRRDLLGGESQPLSILYGRMSTDAVLLPRYCETVTPLSEGRVYVDADGVARVSPRAKRGYTYQAWAFRPDYAAIRDQLAQYGARWYLDGGTPAVAAVNPYGRVVRIPAAPGAPGVARWTDLPDSVTGRTRVLAFELMQDGDTLFDYIARVQHFLSTNYRYNLTVPPLAQDADFVDDFLFELEEGYCTSFASAMAVLLRCAGIPTRYCQGFAMDGTRYKDGVYAVSSRNAHAWVEVLLPEAGWLAFDPTAAGPSSEYRRLQGDITPAPSTPGQTPTPSASPTPGGQDGSPSPTPSGGPSATPASPSGGGQEQPPAPDRTALWLILAAVALAILPFAARAARGRVLRLAEGRAGGRSPSRLAVYWYKRILRLLRAGGFRLLNHETLEEFVARVQADKPDAAGELAQVTALMQRVFYSRDKLFIQADEVRFMARAYRQLALTLSAGWPAYKRLWERYVTGRLP